MTSKVHDFWGGIRWNAEGGGQGGGDQGGQGGSAGGMVQQALGGQGGDQGGQGGDQGGQGGDQGGQGGDQGGQGGDKPTGQTPAGQVYKPEGLPQDLLGENDQQTIDRMFERLNANRPPAKADEYTLDLPENLKAIIPPDDPVLPVFKEVALDQGLSQAQFGNVITKFSEALLEKGFLELPLDVNANFADLGAGEGVAPNEAIERGRSRLRDMADTINGLETRGMLAEGEATLLHEALNLGSKHAKAMEKLLAFAPKEDGLAGNGRANGATVPTLEQVHQRMMDPRYDATSETFSQAFFDETNKQHRLAKGL